MFDTNALGSHAGVFLGWLLRASLSAAGIAIIVLGFQLVLGRWLSPAWRYRLWGIVVLRLILPTLPSSPTSIWNTNIEAQARRCWARLSEVATPKSESNESKFSLGLFYSPVSSEDRMGEPSGPGVTVTVVKQPFSVSSLPAEIPPSSPALIPHQTWKSQVVAILGLGWFAGVLALATRLVLSNVVLSRALKDGRELRDENVLKLLRRCCREMGIRTPPPLLETDAVAAPAAAGIWRQQILLPPGLFRSLDAEDRRAVLLHELAHISRHDVLLNWLLAVMQIAHWFNPFIWIALARLRSDREMARDAMVLAITSGETNAASGNYVRTLLRLTECVAFAAEHGKSAASTAMVAGMVSQPESGLLPGILGGNRGLKRRIQMAAQFSKTSWPTRWIGAIPAVVLASVLLTDARSQSAPVPKPAPTAPEQASSVAEQKQASIPATQSTSDDKNIRRLIDQSHVLMEQGQYAKALNLVDEILKLEPTNDFASGVRPLLADKVTYDALRKGRDTKPGQTQPSRIEAREVLVEPDPKIEQADAEVRNALDRMMPALNFDGVGLSDVVDFLRDVSNVNIFVNWKNLAAAGIDRNTPVSATFRNIKFSKLIDIVLESVGGGKLELGYTIDAGVITISTADDLARNVVVRVYDIRDLLMVIPNVVSTPDVVSNPATQPAGESRQDRVDALKKLIMDTVATKTWKDRGGIVGAMRELEGQLIVTQTPEYHRQLIALLDSIRESRFTQVTVETRFISCDEKLLADILPELKWGAPTTQPAGDPSSAHLSASLTNDQVQQVMRAVQKSRDTTLITAPRITLFNGQRAFVRVSTSRAYIGDYSATTKANGEVRYDPIPKTYEAGLVTNVTAATNANRKFITLTLHPELKVYLGSKRVPWAGSPKGVELMVEEPQVKTSELETTVNIPDGGTMLLGGYDDPGLGTGSLNAQPLTSTSNQARRSSPPQGDLADGHVDGRSRRLYLLVRSTILPPKKPDGAATHPQNLLGGENPGQNDAQGRPLR